MMKIITVPHPTLRSQAEVITDITPELVQFSTDLGTTLKNKKNPQGVGLAAPQVNKSWRLFASFLPPVGDEEKPAQLTLYYNPTITKTSPEQTLGPNPEDPILEGCLSIPSLYGPVPRWEWIEIQYQEIVDGRWQEKNDRLADFPARVFQHELDHLNGVLFTDYALQYELPIYQENARTKKMEEVDRTIVQVF